MTDLIKQIASTIAINTEFLSKIGVHKTTLEYLQTQDYASMPEAIRAMNLKLLEDTKKLVSYNDENPIVEGFKENQNTDAVEYIENYPGLKNLLLNAEIAESYEKILDADLQLVDAVTEKIKGFLEESEKKYSNNYEELLSFIEKRLREKYFGEKFSEKKKVVIATPEKKEKINYVVSKSHKSVAEVQKIITDYIRKNEAIFNKIIFDGKKVTLSIIDRIVNVSFKSGFGYIINFISEPDTNVGKFYQNLLKVFAEIKEKIYLEHNIVVVAEEGKGLIYLNSFYQNYAFIKEKLDTILIKYKLQHSLLNESFSINYMIFDKSCNKYLIFYNGNKELSKAVEQYLNNQAKLGPVTYRIEFIEYNDSINSMMSTRLTALMNKIDLVDANNYMKIKQLSHEKSNESLIMDITGVRVLINPTKSLSNPKSLLSEDTTEDTSDKKFNVIILTDARKKYIDELPKIMLDNPDAKLFTSDITYKLARVKWINNINNLGFGKLGETPLGYNRKDIESLNDRVIRITPEGKGYNFRGLINIKFFNAGSIPGASVVELRDSKHKILYLGDFSTESTGLLKGAELEPNQYDYIFVKSDIQQKEEVKSLPIERIREKLDEDKQVFIFSDSIGNLQHVTPDLFSAQYGRPIIAGDATFSIINKEIAKLINFGSSWGDNFEHKETFVESINCISPFIDEYEFYKLFSTDEPMLFILPYGKAEVDMIIKNKIDSNHLIIIPEEYSKDFDVVLDNYIEISMDESLNKNRPVVYNYMIRTDENKLASYISSTKGVEKIFVINDKESNCIENENLKNKFNYLELNKEITVY